MSETYKLHTCYEVGSISQIIWPKKLWRKKLPNLYVEVRLEQSVQRTTIVKRSATPTWDQELPLLGSDSSTLCLSVKHRTSNPFVKDACLGSISINLGQLLQKCSEDNQHIVLELGSMEGRVDITKGFITVLLSTSDPAQTGSIAVSNARRDIERGDIAKLSEAEPIQAIGTAVNVVAQLGDVVTALGNVVSKLDLFVRIVDEAAKDLYNNIKAPRLQFQND